MSQTDTGVSTKAPPTHAEHLALLGVCYYPEHWPPSEWEQQARQIREAGITLVRIAEFAWSRIEPRRGDFQWAWLDRAIDVLAQEGLSIIMCTPTACPPRWLVDEQPDILPVDDHGRPRIFGSRRHYRFASQAYRAESRRICQAVVNRYGAHPAIAGWQTDNEYGCHETTLSYSSDDLNAFRRWLAERYGQVDVLNRAWGTVFWSQEYREFSEVELPNLTVTEANPAHRMDYWRFASDQVRAFNREQIDILANSDAKSAWTTHNYMGNFTDFDHFDVARDMDVASWDSYPLGFLDQGWFTDEEKARYRQIGHPDWAAFHHDLYRAVGRGRLAVMEQQPGPVNWAPANAMPVDNAPAFWGMEAIAHGAEFVSYFRFRQLPQAQEQMHAALRLPNGEAAPAWDYVKTLHRQITDLPATASTQAKVALLFDYESCWASRIQPHSPEMDSFRCAFEYYEAARSLGLDVDIVSPEASMEGYDLLLIPGSIFVPDGLVKSIQAAGTDCVVACRSGSRDDEFSLPDTLPPGHLQALLPIRVIAVDSMRYGATRGFTFDGVSYEISRWYESVASDIDGRIRCDDGEEFWYVRNNHHYLNAHVPVRFLAGVIQEALKNRDIECTPMPEGLRLRRRGSLCFVFNSSPDAQSFTVDNARRLIGDDLLQQGDYAVWQCDLESCESP